MSGGAIRRRGRDDRPDPHAELNLMIVRLVAAQSITWTEAVAVVRAALRDVERAHASGQPLTERDEARARAVAEGNTEGFATDPEPIPEAFQEPEERGQ